MEKGKKQLDFEAPIKFICNHIAGENHKPVHRRVCGLVVAFIGVCFAAAMHEVCHVKMVVLACDFWGFTMHAAGVVPLLKKYMDV